MPEAATISEPVKLIEEESLQYEPITLIPNPECLNFVDRADEQEKILHCLRSNSNVYHLSLHGLGGAGKTSLALHVAYRCLFASRTGNENLPTFEAFIFTSAKPQRLTFSGVSDRLLKEASLESVLQKIAIGLKCENLTQEGLSLPFVINSLCVKLSQKPTLLIIDNLETMKDLSQVLDFLQELPPSVKTITTTREALTGLNVKNFEIGSLSKKSGHQLILQRCQEAQIGLNSEQIASLYKKVGGIPAVLNYAIGLLADGNIPFPQVTTNLVESEGDYCQFYFQQSLTSLRHQPSYIMLMALALFPAGATFEALAVTATVNGEKPTLKDINALKRRSLIYQQPDSVLPDRYNLIAITREHALSEMAKNQKLFDVLQKNWIEYYRDYVQVHGKQDWKEWQQDYRGLQAEWENINAVVDTFIEDNQYLDLYHMWQHIRCYIHTEWSGSNRLEYWDHRLNALTNRLLALSEQHRDWSVLVDVILDRAGKLVLMRQPQYLEEAASLLERGWHLRRDVSPAYQAKLAACTGILYLHKEILGKATYWLEKAQTILSLLMQSSDTSLALKRQQVQIVYHQGEIYFRQENYIEAKKKFNYSKQLCKTISWQRGVALAQNWLADIAIELNDWDEAGELIDEGILIARDNDDQCRLAYWLATKDKLQKKKNLLIATETNHEAYEIFIALGMKPEAQELKALQTNKQREGLAGAFTQKPTVIPLVSTESPYS